MTSCDDADVTSHYSNGDVSGATSVATNSKTNGIITNSILAEEDLNDADVGCSQVNNKCAEPSANSVNTERVCQVGSEKHNAWDDIIETSFPSKLKSKALKLYRFIQQFGDDVISFDRRGSIIYRGKIIPRTHVLDLLKYVVSNRSGPYRPPGYDLFIKALDEINIPRYLLKLNANFVHEKCNTKRVMTSHSDQSPPLSPHSSPDKSPTLPRDIPLTDEPPIVRWEKY